VPPFPPERRGPLRPAPHGKAPPTCLITTEPDADLKVDD
jgi:hypothetical protein